MKEFRFSIFGAGNIARKFADAAARVEGCQVISVASKDERRAASFAAANGIPRHYDHYAGMLEAEKPDCVYIATTCDSHEALSALCVSRGVPVLCEKSMFSDAVRAERFFDTAEHKKVFSMEALWSRFLPAVLQAKEWIASGRIGDLVFVDFELGFCAPRDMANRYFNPTLGGGAANDLTVYGLHLIPYVTNRSIRHMTASVTAAPSGVDETSVVLLELSGGLSAVLKSTLAAPADEHMALYGTCGKIVIPKPHMARNVFLYDKQGCLADSFEDVETENGFVYEIAEVLRCIRAGQLESPVVPHASTLEASRGIQQILAMLPDMESGGSGTV